MLLHPAIFSLTFGSPSTSTIRCQSGAPHRRVKATPRPLQRADSAGPSVSGEPAARGFGSYQTASPRLWGVREKKSSALISALSAPRIPRLSPGLRLHFCKSFITELAAVAESSDYTAAFLSSFFHAVLLPWLQLQLPLPLPTGLVATPLRCALRPLRISQAKHDGQAPPSRIPAHKSMGLRSGNGSPKWMFQLPERRIRPR